MEAPLTRLITRIVSILAAKYLEAATLLATIIEDLPYAKNRLVLDSSKPSGFVIHYTKSAELLERISLMQATLKKFLAQHKPVVFSNIDDLNFGHPMGTCRFGSDPGTSVLDETNRVRNVDNLYVVDASFFPSSGGANPSLTIAANALRVGELIEDRLRKVPH